LTDGGQNFEYRMVLRTTKRERTEQLADALRMNANVLEFRISPAGD
jgi:putative Mg2+ transporter-C (MgtC) family protein